MADFVAIYLDSGRSKRATDFAAGRNTPITTVDYGRGNGGSSTTRTTLADPFPTPVTFSSPGGLAIGDTVQANVSIPEEYRAPDDIDIHEA